MVFTGFMIIATQFSYHRSMQIIEAIVGGVYV